MKATWLCLPVVAGVLCSCDKAKEMAAKTATAVQEEISAKVGVEKAKVDDALMKLVDQTDDGVIFRKDLPFPKRLEVVVTRRSDLSGRFVKQSEIQNKVENLKGSRVRVALYERAGEQIRYTLQQSSFLKPVPGETEMVEDVPKGTLEQLASKAKPLVFKRSNGKWKADPSSGFRGAALERELSGSFEQLLIENALEARPMWFAKKRLKVGDTLKVSGKSLPMLISGDATGELDIKLESIEPMEGHPCGVFSVTGEFKRRNMPDFEGGVTDQDVTIQSGKLWLSLVYPLVLKEELETIQTLKTGGGGGLVERGQGSVKTSVTRIWKVPTDKKK